MTSMRKTVAVLLCVLLCLTAAGCAGLSEGIRYKEVPGGLALYRYTGVPTVKELVIPALKNGKPVVEIMEFALSSAEYLTTITIGRNVKTIDNRAFTYCPALEKFAVEAGNAWFETDEDGILYSKNKQVLIAYPAARVPLTIDAGGKIATGAEVTIPGTVTEIADAAFYLCGNLTSVVFPEGLKRIGDYAFMKCENLTDFTLPDSLTDIGRDAFSYCDSLTTVTIPAGVITIGDYAFFSLSSKILTITVVGRRDAIAFGKDWVPLVAGQVNVPVEVIFESENA